MVESLGIPVDQIEVCSVVVGVAADTVLRSWLSYQIRMQSPMSRQAASDLSVAFCAFELGLTRAELVAGNTLRRAV